MMDNGATRPQGVTILAILAAIGGVLGIFGGFAIVAGGALASVLLGPLGGLLLLLGLVLLVLSVAQLALAYGFWTLKAWAWRFGYLLMAANVIVGLLFLLTNGDLFNFVVTLVIAGIIAYYLDTPGVRHAFGAPATGFPIVGNSLDGYLAKVRSRS